MPLENSLNDVNTELLEKLKGAGAEINFIVEGNADSWFMQERSAFSVGAPNEDLNPAGMAHELLHIELSMKGFWSTRNIYKFFHEQNSSFNIHFITSLCNDLAHFKKLDPFIAMGYSINDFLQKTPKQYFIEGIFLNTNILLGKHKAGLLVLCQDILEIIRLVGAAKLFELYKQKDDSTVNGVHADLVLNPLREIDKDLVEGLVQPFVDWSEADTVDNLQFFIRLNVFLKERGIPTALDCN